MMMKILKQRVNLKARNCWNNLNLIVNYLREVVEIATEQFSQNADTTTFFEICNCSEALDLLNMRKRWRDIYHSGWFEKYIYLWMMIFQIVSIFPFQKCTVVFLRNHKHGTYQSHFQYCSFPNNRCLFCQSLSNRYYFLGNWKHKPPHSRFHWILRLP